MNATQESATDREEKTLIEVYKTLHARVKVIRDHHGCSIPDAVQRFGGPAIDAEYARIVRQMNAELQPAPTGGEG